MNFTSSKKIGRHLLLLLALGSSLPAAEISTNSWPAPATGKINFDRDIRPILETSCIRCHGAEKPRSHFRLDNRVAALKGGDENTNDLVPGDSANSLLIRYVARQVPDMEMPPPGKGEPLTAQQIKSLSSWIDQGMDWDTTNQPPSLTFAFSPEFQWLDVSGNKSKFRELEGVPDGFAGGVSHFSAVQQVGPDEKMSLSGHVIAPGRDVAVQYTLDKNDFGFIHAGFTEWRKYYSPDGGYDPTVTPSGFNLDRNLYIDNGDAWIDFGLALPHRPVLVLGYEYQFRQGTQPTLDWGTVVGANTKNIYPATQDVDEKTHIIKLTVTDDFDDWHLEDHARVEFYRLNNNGNESTLLPGDTSPSILINTADNYHSVQGMNTLTLEKQIRDWWFASGGFYYSKLSGSDFFNQTTVLFGTPLAPLTSQQITLRRESEIFSLASLFTPLDYLTLSVGIQNEWTSEDGFGDSVPDLDVGLNFPASSSADSFKSSQNATLRFTQIPFSVLFADARFDEESINESEDQDAGPNATQTQTAVGDYRYAFKTGFNVSPWRWLAWNTQFGKRSTHTSYNFPVDMVDGVAGATNGYPGFILDRQIQANEFETKLDLRPARWLKTTLSYQLSDTRYTSDTEGAFDPFALETVSPGGTILDGHYRMQTYGLGATFTPVSRFYLTGAFTYSHSRAIPAANGDPSIVPYDGNIFTITTTATYALNVKTALQAGYIFSSSDYGENDGVNGVPPGLDFTRHELILGLTRKLTKRLTGALHYEFSQYNETGTGNMNNFTANGIFASFAYRWP